MFLVINDLNESFQKQLLTLLPEDSKIFSQTANPLNHCIGCFGCWTKTPGLCLINDISRDINSVMIKSDIFLIITKITYGCYSPYIKNVIDRGIPTLLPFFKKVNNEIHHKPRYGKYPKLVVVGYGEDVTFEEEETFKKLIKANAINLQSNGSDVYTIKKLEELNNVISRIVGGSMNE